jgi:succinyl-CoA synthetase beta subunit
MVKLLEWQGKEIFRNYGIPLPKGAVARSADDVVKVLGSHVSLPCVIKAQVRVGGRGKGGALRFASTPEEARKAAEEILGSRFKDETVKEVLIEQKLPIDREIYLSLTLDRSKRLPILMGSAEGGVEIENVPDEKIFKLWIHPFAGVLDYQKRQVAKLLGLSGDAAKEVAFIIDMLWKIFQGEDAELVEINPLVVSAGHLVALDSKVIIEDDAVFRHPQYEHLQGDLTDLEEKAHEKGIAFVEMGGDVGVIANGAGLTMATLDVLLENGGKPGVFLDLGGTDDPKKVAEAFLLMSEAKPKVVFINIFGGVTRCDTVANGLVSEIKRNPPNFGIITRIRGNNEREGKEILNGIGIGSYSDLAEAVRQVVAMEVKP